ncbi:hypothetical protein HGRIS_010872 [Hohenbuehelia grisea]|uniref:Fungal-type protein kinase domain-containing protein n=2 Tax=Hohenbuehelia grisea TaxID=104357 RepID=A0ABR3IYC9_9AGAR
MTTVTDSQWSGNKQAAQAAHSRQQQTKQIEENAMRFCAEFSQHHLRPLVTTIDQTAKIAESREADQLRRTYKNARDVGSPQIYEALVGLLNYLSDKIYANLPPEKRKGKIVFRDHHSRMLDHHPRYNDTRVLPDIVAILQSTEAHYDMLDDRVSLSWHHLLSVVEEKSPADKKNGPAQGGTYVAYACQARPDIPAMYGASFSPSGYTILYNDATGIEKSEEFSLNDLNPLAQYVYALYSPPDSHDTRDTSITLSSRLFDAPRWTVEYQDVIYRDCRVTFVGAPHKRQTWIAVCDEPLAVIKDSWWETGRNWDEGELFNVLHEDGTVPGWVQIRSCGRIPRKGKPGYLETFLRTMGATRKFKKRIIMSTFGEKLSRCGSVLEFLKAMYDVLEAHRFAALDRNILHRDISQDNILVHPRGAIVPHLVGPRPKFIHEIIDGVEHAPPVAVLCDLDNGCELDRMHAKTPTFRSRKNKPKSDDDYRNPQRTGTPMYVARALCEAKFQRHMDYAPMPPIPDARYSVAHTWNPPRLIRSLQDEKNTFHGSTKSDERDRFIKQEQYKRHQDRDLRYHKLFYHRVRYDAESVYWVIVTFLLLAKPSPRKLKTDHSVGPDAEDAEERLMISENDDDDPTQGDLARLWLIFAEHKILDTTQVLRYPQSDSRSSVFDSGVAGWEDVLHPKLVSMAEMLFELSQQVQPEYVYLKPDLDDTCADHLHEAMQRILLKHILPMWNTDGIPLFKSIHRNILEPIRPMEYRMSDGFHRTAKGQSHPGTNGSKRSDADHGDGTRSSKRSRGNDATVDKGKSREGEGSRASQKSGKGSGSRASKRSASGAGAGPSTMVTRSKAKK